MDWPTRGNPKFAHLAKLRVRAARSDLVEGVLQILTVKSCREYHASITDMGIYVPDRIIMGATDASAHFQVKF
jgi:hypothetical protein